MKPIKPIKLADVTPTAQKMEFSIKDFFSKYDQIRRKLWIWSQLLKKSLMENFIFCAVCKIQKEDLSRAKNYRPVGFPPSVSKIFERVLHR